MFIALTNSSGDPDLAMAMTDCMLPHWSELADALAPIKHPDGVEGLMVGFAEGLPRSHFQQERRGIFCSTITGIDKHHFLTKASAKERRDYVFDFVTESLERVDWPDETRKRIGEIFQRWRAALPSEV